MSNEQVYAQLADLLPRALLDILKNGRVVTGPDGEERRITATASDLNVIRGILKDNGINSVTTADSPINELVSEMSKRGLRFRPQSLAGDNNEEEAA